MLKTQVEFVTIIFVKALTFWGSVFSFLVGVALGLIASFDIYFVAFLLLYMVVCLALFWGDKKVAAMVFVCLSFSAGIARVYVAELGQDTYFDGHIGEEILINGLIAMEPDERENTTRIVVETEEDVRIIASIPRSYEVFYGQRIIIKGEITHPEPFSSDGGREFNYPAYLAKDDVYYQISFPEIVSIGDIETNGFGRGYLFALKNKYTDGLALMLAEPGASLAGGITVGDKRALGGNLLDLFRITGIIHIVVLSGYNITIVAENIRRILFGLPRAIGLWASAISILLFVIMTGATATGVRAGAMASLALIANATNRRYAITRALALTATAMVLWSPHILLYDPGFQLSVIATLGLIHVAPLISDRLPFITERFGLRDIIGATIGTQIAVLPLLLYQTGLLSLVALPTNILILPIIPLAMLFSFMAGALGALFGSVVVWLALPSHLLLSYTLLIVDVFGRLPLASVSLESFSFIWVIASYATLLYLVFYIKKRSQARVAPGS
ncbi:hypothetical protein COU13_01865 [Candidatus Kaiserbacteria bacterium CG10_big_fil_rev_8_21_14_0_10_43_70]|uniref:ComEC/Rec2-related protein domain-containing protein n=1 Tax=Candidatus Kaiserbacteria bacterium CG10_big_fil_rev_8_21_14_0_10_43_70 TaxID=1974605 RepID=A0A2H0UIR1_9BACT|nr:MAG: hypothetical protein COU13_01865 [Candidatus Kaiserbacteria bacterium CG10_big_fil_rev_8_21_14_0_10_43_70]